MCLVLELPSKDTQYYDLLSPSSELERWEHVTPSPPPPTHTKDVTSKSSPQQHEGPSGGTAVAQETTSLECAEICLKP